MMKRYILLPLLSALIPNMVLGASASYSKLLHEKQRKMEQLEKCMGASKGLQVAGVSTLGLTAVGVAGNIYEAKTIKENESTIKSKQKTLEGLDAKLQAKKEEKIKKEAEKSKKEEEKTKKEEIEQQEDIKPEIDEGKEEISAIKTTDFETVEDFDSFVDSLSVEEVTIGSSISIPTELLLNENVSSEIENWKSYCDSACGQSSSIHCVSEKVDEKQVDDKTVYTCLIDKCEFEGTKFKKSEDELTCEPITPVQNVHESEDITFVSAAMQLVNKGKQEETVHLKMPEGVNIQSGTPNNLSGSITYVQPNPNAIETPHIRIKSIDADEAKKDSES